MILDSSAAIAVIIEEPGHERIAAAMAGAERIAIGAPTLLEAEMVAIGRAGEAGRTRVAALMARHEVIEVPFTEAHRRVATDAFARFGKGRNPAGLNYGDCMTYATAKLAGLPLLFTGEDFARTDIAAALTPS